MFNLIDGIMQYSQLDRVKPNIQKVVIKNLLDDLIDTLNPPKTFSIQYSDNLPSIQTEESLLNQIFSNLIKNSIIHHHRTTGSVKISSKYSKNFYTFCVADDGPGIQLEYQEKIFKIFQTLQPKDVLDTTGIGLSIVKKIVEAQGGQVTLDSEIGRGSIFCFTWPKYPPKYPPK